MGSCIYNFPEIIKDEKKTQFKTFLVKVFETLHPNKKMISNWHLDLIIEYLKAIESGDMKWLIVNLPPRSLKSVCINVAWPAWLLGQAPDTKIIAVSYNQELSENIQSTVELLCKVIGIRNCFLVRLSRVG